MNARVKLDAPCPKCGTRFGYHVIDTSNEEAEELPIILRCTRGHHIATITGEN